MKRYALLALFLSTFAYAAKVGTVTKDDAFIYERPQSDGPALFKLPVGSVVTTSNLATQGFYKIKTDTGVIGWVSADSMALTGDLISLELDGPGAPEVKVDTPSQSQSQSQSQSLSQEMASAHELFSKRISLKLVIGADYVSLSEINQLVGTTLFNSVLYYGGELGFSLNRDFDLLLRVEKITGSSAVSATTFKVTSSPMMVGLDYRLVKSTRLTLSSALLVGYASSTQLTETAAGLPSPNVTQFSGSSITEAIRLSGDLRISRWLKLYTELGYRLLKTSSALPAQTGAGGTIFQTNGNYVAVPVNLNGVFLGGGFKIGF